MKSLYEVKFSDGSTVEGEHDNADAAKTAARNDRIREIDPGRRMAPADVAVHARVKVDSVRELTREQQDARARAAAPGGDASSAERGAAASGVPPVTGGASGSASGDSGQGNGSGQGNNPASGFPG
jgi:hypothetical protein